MTDRSLGHRAPLLWIVAPLMAGLTLGKLVDAANAWPWLAAALVLSGVAIFASFRAEAWFSALLLAAMFAAGVASFAIHRPRIAAWDALPPREAELTVEIERVFASSAAGRASALGRIVSASEPLQELAGQRTYVSLSLRRPESAPLRSAVVRVAGVIASLPPHPATGSFDAYLVDSGITFRLTRARLRGTVQEPTAYRRFCARAAQRLSELLGAGVTTKCPDQVGVYRAMMLGQQNELTEEQTALYRKSGTMHVFSISGLHIAAIATGLQAVLLLLRLPAVVRFALGLAALWLYVDITGCAPSAVRAFVMVALVQASLVLRAPRNPVSALAASALVVLVVTPLQLFSASFQMSYGIVAALLLIGLPLAAAWNERLALFRHLPKPAWTAVHRFAAWTWQVVLGAAAIGVAASLVSAVTGITFFGLFTPGAFVVNLWLIPASVLAIFCGFFSLLCGLLGIATGSVVANHAAMLLLRAIDRGVHGSLAAPAMWFDASFRAPWIGPAALTLVLVAAVFGYARNWTGWSRGYWAPFAVVALALACGVRFS